MCASISQNDQNPVMRCMRDRIAPDAVFEQRHRAMSSTW
jgi:hypothetical protein